MTYCQIEGRPTLWSYSHARVNERYVLVDSTGRIVEVIDQSVPYHHSEEPAARRAFFWRFGTLDD